MQAAPIPDFEEKRLAALRSMGILDTVPEERFDRLTREATEQFHVPIAAITLIDAEREWFKSCQGLSAREGKRSESFCGHAMLSKLIFVVEDTLEDERFADNPMVTGAPYIRFYAAVVLHHRPTNLPVGVFCIKDTKPRKMSPAEVVQLIDLGKRAEAELNVPA